MVAILSERLRNLRQDKLRLRKRILHGLQTTAYAGHSSICTTATGKRGSHDDNS